MASENQMIKYVWSKEKCLELIQLYRKREELWNPQSNLYHQKNLKCDGWREVAERLEVPVDICYAKMVSLLASFRRERGKVKKSSGAGRGINDVYKSKWFAFKSLEFLNDRKPTVTKTFPTTIRSQNEDQNKGEVDADADAKVEVEMEVEVKTKTETKRETETEAEAEGKAETEVVVLTDRNTSTPLHGGRTATRTRRTSRTTSDNAVIDEAMDIIRNVKKRDCIQAFGVCLVERMRKLKRRNQIMLMQAINTALYEKEFSELESESGSERASGSTD